MWGGRPELAEGREHGRDISRSLAVKKRMIIRADCRLEAGCFSQDGTHSSDDGGEDGRAV